MSISLQKAAPCILAVLLVLPIAFSFPGFAFATTCGTGFTDNGAGSCVAFLTSTATSTITIPSNWNSSNNKIEAIGGGGGTGSNVGGQRPGGAGAQGLIVLTYKL